MIPLIDDFLQMYIAKRLKWLKENPAVLDLIFATSKRETLTKLKDFITNQKIKVIIGFPREQTQLPAYVITLAPESEQPIGLGDQYADFEAFTIVDDENVEKDEDAETVDLTELEQEMMQFLASTYMNSTYRIECWSDNGDLTAYMYVILKWAIWTSRLDMLRAGWVNIRMTGSDLEPVPDYMPIFVYRRAAQVELTYENLYYENIDQVINYVKILKNPDKYKEDDEGIKDKETGEVILPAETWRLIAHYYKATIFAK